MKEYDIAISFAGEDRTVAESIATSLRENGVKVFYDNFENADLWGKNLHEYLIEIYKNKSKYCLMVLSDSYQKKLWTNHERKAAQARAFRDNNEYILPLRIDDSEITGILETVGYLDYRSETTQSIVRKILIKLWGDLRSDTTIKFLREKLEQTYQKTMATCDLAFMPSDHPRKNSSQLAMEFHYFAESNLADLKKHSIIYAPVLDRLVISQLGMFLEAITIILKRAVFINKIKDPVNNNLDFVSEIPEKEMYFCFDFLSKLQSFDDHAVKTTRFHSPSDILINWKKAENESTQYHSDPASFKPRKGRFTIVFNKKTLTKLSLEHMEGGLEIFVYDLGD